MLTEISERRANVPEKWLPLLRAAVRSLAEEDQALREAMGRGAKRTGGYSDVAHGLTYWLFETTLVYFVFRAWLPLTRVAWEHAVGDRSNRPAAGVDIKRGASEKCDLIVFDADGRPEAAFEAKWWNTKASGEGILTDVRKLRRTCPHLAKYVLAFWWGTDFDRDFAEASDFCVSNGILLQYVAIFDTQLFGPTKGYFALSIIHVP